jgi:zinc finger protein
MRSQLEESCAMFRDSNDAESKNSMNNFLARLDDALCNKIQVTLSLCLDDPAGNSYVQALTDDGTPDDGLTVETYHRSHDQNEDLGINDMKTENYEETENK